MSHCLVIKVLCFLSFWQLIYFITSVFVCQELFSSFSNFFVSHSRRFKLCLPSRGQLGYITTTFSLCQRLFSSFFRFFPLLCRTSNFRFTMCNFSVFHFQFPYPCSNFRRISFNRRRSLREICTCVVFRILAVSLWVLLAKKRILKLMYVISKILLIKILLTI